MITDSQKSKVQMKNNEDRGNREKKEEKLDSSISNHETVFLIFLKFIAFTIAVNLKSFVIRSLSISTLPRHKKIHQIVTFMGINL